MQSIILGLVQGLTEFLPVSSSGHLIIARELFHYSLEGSLTFDIFLNTATLFAVIYCFWGEIKRIFVDLFSQGLSHRSWNLIICLIIGTVPAALVGFWYGDQIESLFRYSHSVAWALIAGSIIMLIADQVNKRDLNHTGVSPLKSLLIGMFQTLALIPGVSRAGATISGGLLAKLSREEAIRFSFLLYIPVSLGAALKAFFDITLDGSGSGIHTFFTLPYILGFLVALFSGVWAVRFMVRYLSRNSFTPFIIYRILLAVAILLFLN